jgi:hypothetical protein
MPSDAPPPAEPPGSSLAPLDRAALERVLARATELQARLADTPDELTEKQVLELASEVGISSDHMRQALAEERTRVVMPAETGVVGSWFGSTVAAASRVVPGTPAEVLSLLDTWMQRQLQPRGTSVRAHTSERSRRDGGCRGCLTSTGATEC